MLYDCGMVEINTMTFKTKPIGQRVLPNMLKILIMVISRVK